MKINEKVIAKKIQGEMVLLNMENGDYFSLNKLGTEIFDHISAGMQINEIIESLFKKYDVGMEILEKDARELIQEMCAKKILIDI